MTPSDPTTGAQAETVSQAAPTSDQPIHICIGSARSGTTWLFNNLIGCDGIFLPCVKEVRFWLGSRSGVVRDADIKTHMAKDVSADQASWLERWGKADTLDGPTYRNLMTHPTMPAMDISPSYARMTREGVEDLAAVLPKNSKVVFFVRNPLDRAMSQLKLHAFLHGKFRGPIGDGTLLDFASRPVQRARNRYADIIDLWQSVFGDRFKTFNFEALDEDPELFFKEVTGFLDLGPNGDGLDSQRATTYFGTDQNMGSKSIFPSFTPRQKSLIAQLTLDDALDYASVDPVLSQRWAASIRSQIQKPTEFRPIPVEVDWKYERFLRLTESLGDNCEFGFFQRSEDYEPSSLFRWSVTPIDALIKYMDAPRELFLKKNLRVDPKSALVFDSGPGFWFHSHLMHMVDGERCFIPEPRFTEVFDAEKTKIDFLFQRFTRFLSTRPGVFVVKSNAGLKPKQARLLLEKLVKFHPKHAVLCVTEDEKYNLRNPVPGLYLGAIPKFAPYANAEQIQVPSWKRLIRDMAHRPEFEAALNSMFA